MKALPLCTSAPLRLIYLIYLTYPAACDPAYPINCFIENIASQPVNNKPIIISHPLSLNSISIPLLSSMFFLSCYPLILYNGLLL